MVNLPCISFSDIGMDFSESTKVVYDRIQKLEPENVSKIIGYLLLQDHGEREMIRLAFSPDNLIHSLINKAKANLGLSNPSVSGPISLSQANQTPLAEIPLKFTPYAPASRLISPQGTLRPWEAVDFVPHVYSDSFLNLEDHLESVNSISSDFSSSYFYPEPALGIRTSRRSPSMPEFPVKVCHYFNKGFCKHGSNCRYFHGLPMTESISQIFSSNSNDLLNEDNIISLNKLEMEITELLKSRRGIPVSIASLPMLYYEKYGRTLQAEGYLTESQRHGKAGYSLTKLLARLKNSIRLIDRPHGQHSVILAEDVNKYLEYASDKSDHVGIIAGSRQIYLTFPAESTFTEQDVSNYFSKFGHVQDVRIPCQQKRMFGFVTFIFTETVKQILAKGNPHFICGARVLVKPYRDKSRLVERKFLEKFHLPLQYGQQFIDEDSELHQVPRHCDNLRILRKQLIEEHEQALELERMRLSNFQFTPKITPHPCFGYSMEELNFQEEPSADRFNYLLDVFNNGSTSEEKIRSINTSYREQDSSAQGLNLPDSPFASPIGSGISTAI